MRKVYNASGADVTSTVLTFLKNNRTLVVEDLYYFQWSDFPEEQQN